MNTEINSLLEQEAHNRIANRITSIRMLMEEIEEISKAHDIPVSFTIGDASIELDEYGWVSSGY